MFRIETENIENRRPSLLGWKPSLKERKKERTKERTNERKKERTNERKKESKDATSSSRPYYYTANSAHFRASRLERFAIGLLSSLQWPQGDVPGRLPGRAGEFDRGAGEEQPLPGARAERHGSVSSFRWFVWRGSREVWRDGGKYGFEPGCVRARFVRPVLRQQNLPLAALVFFSLDWAGAHRSRCWRCRRRSEGWGGPTVAQRCWARAAREDDESPSCWTPCRGC